MSTRIRLLATSLPLAICLCAVTTGYGQDSKGKDAASPPKNSPTAKDTESDAANPIESLATKQADERDTEFELLVDLRLLGKAWADSDASLLADCALQFAQAERAMSRTHQSITADQLLETAARMAGMNRGQRDTRSPLQSCRQDGQRKTGRASRRGSQDRGGRIVGRHVGADCFRYRPVASRVRPLPRYLKGY